MQELADRLTKGVQKKGYRLVSSRNPAEASGIVSFVSNTQDHTRLVNHLLQEYRTVVASRVGRIRVSPHFYNTEEEIDQLIAHLPAH